MSVYLLHIEPAYRHARHYIGWSKDFRPDDRMEEHLASKAAGNPLVKAAIRAGCTVTVAHVWHRNADRKFERKLKNRKEAPQILPDLCPDGAPTS